MSLKIGQGGKLIPETARNVTCLEDSSVKLRRGRTLLLPIRAVRREPTATTRDSRLSRGNPGWSCNCKLFGKVVVRLRYLGFLFEPIILVLFCWKNPSDIVATVRYRARPASRTLILTVEILRRCLSRFA